MNPYSNEPDSPKDISQLFVGYEFVAPTKTGRPTERGSLIDYFTYKVNQGRKGKLGANGKPLKEVNKTFVAMQLQQFSIRELYFIQKEGERYEAKGKPWGKFYWAVVRTEETGDNDLAEIQSVLHH